jgi:hypothetical protein
MRAKEFIINVPISIAIDGDEYPVVTTGDRAAPSKDSELQKTPVNRVSPNKYLGLQQIPVVNTDNQEFPKDDLEDDSRNDLGDDSELQQNPVMISPQQQELELSKAAVGKRSPVIDKLTQDHTIGEEPPEQNEIIRQLRALMSK